MCINQYCLPSPVDMIGGDQRAILGKESLRSELPWLVPILLTVVKFPRVCDHLCSEGRYLKSCIETSAGLTCDTCI